jgi:hypothetical protein
VEQVKNQEITFLQGTTTPPIKLHLALRKMREPRTWRVITNSIFFLSMNSCLEPRAWIKIAKR